MPKWTDIMKRMAIPSDHVTRPYLRSQADPGHLETQTWAVSTAALIIILCHWSTSLKAAQDKAQALGLLKGLLDNDALRDVDIFVHVSEVGRVTSARHNGDKLIVRNGLVADWDGPYKKALRQQFHACSCVAEVLRRSYRSRNKSIFLTLPLALANSSSSSCRREIGMTPLRRLRTCQPGHIEELTENDAYS